MKEKDIVDSRALQHCRIEQLPSNASEFRAWKNSLYLVMASLDTSGTDYLSSLHFPSLSNATHFSRVAHGHLQSCFVSGLCFIH